ncbi:MAG: 50S ribosomal protein L35 [Myxococcales bacterium]|nr:MAG: 50S ribosomal protein L35 [Myxococcales bacterium]
MPKMKTNSAAAKRFKISGSGRIRRGKAGKSHMMTHGKASNQLRRLRKNDMVDKADEKRIMRLLPYAN